MARIRRVTVLLPISLVALAVGTSYAGVDRPQPAAQEDGTQSTTADAPPATLPTESPTGPATVDTEASATKGANLKAAKELLAGTSAAGIPPLALTAYQRAETVINASEVNCNLDWQLVAAIGRVESDHGRHDGNVLDANGISQPGIYGPVLNGKGGTKAIADTDQGQYDRDPTWDRAVGPMQFIPSTWAIVGVDGDSDGVREPQDIDDAALAAAVYLCSGAENLSTDEGRKSAIYRYNNSKSYVDLVLAIYQQYLAGDYTSTPDVGSYVYTPTEIPGSVPGVPGMPSGTSGIPKGVPYIPPPPGAVTGPFNPDNQGGKPSKGPGKQPTSQPKPPKAPAPPLPSTTGTVDGPLTYDQAVKMCVAEGLPSTATDALVTCANAKLAG